MRGEDVGGSWQGLVIVLKVLEGRKSRRVESTDDKRYKL
jgi:hypothetical protein